jgi:DNA-binding transcriptional ArsR family regulator
MPRRTADASIYQAIADPTRRAILLQLRSGEHTAGDLGRDHRVSQPAISQHLRVLRDAGLVKQRRDGRFRVYALDARGLESVADWVTHFEQFWDRRLSRLGTFLDRRTRQ